MVALSVDERAMIDSVSTLVDRELATQADEIDRTATFPLDFYRSLGKVGFFGAFVPEEYGGIDVSQRATLMNVERIARTSATVALSFGNCGDAVRPIIAGGSEALKREVLPGIADGTKIPCFCLTEAESGSDAAGLKTRAVRDGSDYILNGQKIYITNGSVGDYYTVFARTGEDHAGVTCFLVPRDAEGLRLGRDESLLGLRGMPATVIDFDAVRVSEGWRLGEEGEGFQFAMSALNEARLNMSAVSLGVARRALDEAVAFARLRRSFGKTIIEHDGLGFLLAEFATDLAAAWALFDRAIDVAETADNYRSARAIISMAKLAATTAATKITTGAVQVHGGAGLTQDYVVERLFRDAKAFEILDGTSQIQQLIVSRHLRSNDMPYAELGW